jgi:molybdopterin molybdotransferase
MGILKSRYLASEKPKNTRDAFLLEAVGHACASDVKSLSEDKVLLSKGTFITPHIVADLAEEGIDRLLIYEKPKISLLVIGDELIPPGVPQKIGKVYDASNPALRAALDSMRIRPVFTRRLIQEPKLLKRLIPFALNQSDIVILVIRKTQESLTFIKDFLKPINAQVIYAEEGSGLIPNSNKKIVFCLPNDPHLVLEHFYKCVQPAIHLFMGLSGPLPASH